MTKSPKPKARTKPKPKGKAADRARLVVVTGLSGAGKTSALKVLEDMGYEAVDNLPLPLLSALIGQAGESQQPLAIGVDIRTRDFAVAPFIHELDELIAEKNVDVRLIFLDCDDDALQRRFTETRRRHPLAADRPLMDGIRVERSRLARLRGRADAVIDTTEKTLGELQATLETSFGLDGAPGLAVFVTSFAYGRGLPREADLVFDARFLKNPHYEPDLRTLTGEDEAVGAFIRTDPDFERFFKALTAMLKPLLPRYEKEGKSYLTIAVGCTGGRHRSVYVAERLTEWLNARGQRVNLRHRDAGRPQRAQRG
jgi:UPF0042 nucleotide-binding protein